MKKQKFFSRRVVFYQDLSCGVFFAGDGYSVRVGFLNLSYFIGENCNQPINFSRSRSFEEGRRVRAIIKEYRKMRWL